MKQQNKMFIVGRLTDDPEVRVLPSGSSVTSFGVANNNSYKTKAGEISEQVLFLRCEAWNGDGEAVSKHFRKGNLIQLEGRLVSDQWTDKEGNKKSTIKMVVMEWYFVGAGTSRKPDASPDSPDSPDVHAEDSHSD